MKTKYSIIYISLIFLLTNCAHEKSRDGIVIPKSIESNIELKDINVALVLGGGGSKGFAHLGAIEILEKNNIPIDLIVGSSIGSAVGALYADNQDFKKTKNILFSAQRNDLLDFSLIDSIRTLNGLSGTITGQSYENFIFNNLTAKNFSELKIPLIAVTVDATTGEKFLIARGPIAPAIRASSAIPFLISPVSIYGKTLIDGGIVEPVPVATAKLFNPKIIIAIDINNLPKKTKPSNSIELAYRSFWISYYQLSRLQSKMADIDIHPELSGHGTFEDHKKEELYELGRRAALIALPELKKKLKEINIKTNKKR